MEINLVYRNEFIELVTPIIENEKVKRMDKYIQHGTTSTLDHCIAVAYVSFAMAKKLNIHCDYNSLIRGALLHDYFLYDWHVSDESHKWHGFSHARTALENASHDFELTPIEKDIIEKHMFPLNIKLPKYRESFLITIFDKRSALKSFFEYNKKQFSNTKFYRYAYIFFTGLLFKIF